MRKLLSHRPSAPMIIAIVALVLSLGGSAVAALKGKDKKKVRSIADQEITKLAPGLAVASAGTAGTAGSAGTAGDAAKLGGALPSQYVRGGGHIVMGTKAAGSSSSNNALLTIPGIGSITFDCAANGNDSLIHIANSSGTILSMAGQDQDSASSSFSPVGHIAAGTTTDFSHSGTAVLATTRLQLWNSQAGKTATVVLSNLSCDYTGWASTNQ